MKITVDLLSDLVLSCTQIEGILENYDYSDEDEYIELFASKNFFSELGNHLGTLRQAMINNKINEIGKKE